MPWIAKVVEKYSPDGKLISKKFYVCPVPVGKCKESSSLKAAIAEAARLTALESQPEPPVLPVLPAPEDGPEPY